MPARKYTPDFRAYILAQYESGIKPGVLEKQFGLTSGQVCKWAWMRANDYRASKQLRTDLNERDAQNRELIKDNNSLISTIHRLTRRAG